MEKKRFIGKGMCRESSADISKPRLSWLAGNSIFDTSDRIGKRVLGSIEEFLRVIRGGSLWCQKFLSTDEIFHFVSLVVQRFPHRLTDRHLGRVVCHMIEQC